MNRENATCFLLEDLGTARYRLRRYAGESKCATEPHGYHQAFSGVVAERPDDRSQPYHGSNPPEVAADDPMWPARCACGYAFADSDTRQVWADGLYRRDDGAVMTWDEAPAGAVCDAFWWPDKGADGHAWSIKLPSGDDFMTESTATNCGCRTRPSDAAHRCWTRTGVAPKLTVSPSISVPKWHGFLRNGVLESC